MSVRAPYCVGSWDSCTLTGKLYGSVQLVGTSTWWFISILSMITQIDLLCHLAFDVHLSSMYMIASIITNIVLSTNTQLWTFISISFIIRFTTALVYYGLSLNAAAFGDVFMNNFLNGLVEIPAYLLCMLCMTKGNKRLSNALCLLVAAVFCLSCVVVLMVNEGKYVVFMS